MNNIRLLLADDHPLIRAGFKSMLVKNERFEIVGEAENGTDLLTLTAELSPDMILTDISMPGMNGLEALQKVKKQYPAIKCIVLSMHEEREYIMNALKTGAEGYLLKSIEGPELEKAILVVFNGGKYFSPLITSILADSVARPELPEVGDITPREKEVLELVAQGKSTKQIADLLGISIRTVESHRINMLKKMKVNNTAELIRKAIEMKILS
ncbi:two component transcriptional regulator, LuxR family [Chryseolinea serpens]|uniref:Two component transcriptional regulator, LuxR family n=1 Tax=Chryseolinea serpens TaxID=947013 RepID=A0A1M5WN32_9BACT|nr:response regulator transcription factor [Chryseolinea serpens]SHH88898.1 two component transcriptional regulator, LuxR family [Chryseolinea serpens]